MSTGASFCENCPNEYSCGHLYAALSIIEATPETGLDPKVCRLFIIDGAKALSKVIRRTFGAHTPIQRRQGGHGIVGGAITPEVLRAGGLENDQDDVVTCRGAG